MKKSDATVEALGVLAGAHDRPPADRRPLLRRHLANRSNWVVAKAAKIAGEVRDEELAAELVTVSIG
jgi:hypothetical protein